MGPISFPLVGPGGEPVDLWRTLTSHGLAELPPMQIDPSDRSARLTLRVPGGRPRVVRIRAVQGRIAVEVEGPAPGRRAAEHLRATCRRVLGMDQDLSPFYEIAARDPDLSWVTTGAGRMVRSATVFEDVVKTLCTTNCSWAMTTKMVTTLVGELGTPARGAPPGSWQRRAFPTPEAMAAMPERFYREVVRAGYRAPHLRELARRVQRGDVDLESILPSGGIEDDEVERFLISLPGIGPYAAAHVMHVVGRHSRLILDSWTRPKYARLLGRSSPYADRTILRRFRPYGPYTGLAFWLFLTRDWVAEEVGLADTGAGRLGASEKEGSS